MHIVGLCVTGCLFVSMVLIVVSVVKDSKMNDDKILDKVESYTMLREFAKDIMGS